MPDAGKEWNTSVGTSQGGDIHEYREVRQKDNLQLTMQLVGLLLSLTCTLSLGESEVPETIYLPYSETEDVDFTIDRPTRVGCYQW